MSIPTRILENGQWVTRFLDPFQVLARNKAQHEEESEPVPEISHPPSLAIITQTLIASPVLKWICPARIRHETRNDVLLITEDAVHVKEARPDYTLDHVTVKADFDSPIRIARAFGLPSEATKPEPSALVKTEGEDYCLHDEHTSKTDGKQQRWFSENNDSGVAAEANAGDAPPHGPIQDLPNNNTTLAGVARPSSRHLPPQMLILVLENENIVFLYATSGPADRPHLMASQRPLPHFPLRLHQLGERIAVDPKSRAVAIAAHEEHVYLYALKSRQNLQTELRESASIMPIEEEKAFAVDGIIHNMEFLHPVQDDPGRVILLLVVAKDGKSKLVWYEWDTEISLRQATVSQNTHRLPPEDGLPLLLIPLLAFSGFILFSENKFSTYTGLLTGIPNRYVYESSYTEPVSPSLRKSPIWVQWARPVRSPSRPESDDNIYICREDGIIRYLDLNYNLPQILAFSHNAGELGTTIDTSFAAIDLGLTAHDLLIAGGDTSEGGLWLLCARKSAQQLSIRSNWTPLHDSVITSASKDIEGISEHQKSTQRQSKFYQRFLGCTGRAKYGSIAELRYGTPATRSSESVHLGIALTSTIVAMWAFRHIGDALHILICYPTSSSLLQVRQGYESELLDEWVGFDLSLKTIASTCLANGMMFQVTETGVYGTVCTRLGFHQYSWKHDFSSTSERVVAAAIGPGVSRCPVVLATEREHKYFLLFGMMGSNLEIIGEATALRAQPTCIALHSSDAWTLVLVGFVDVEGGVDIFMTSEDGCLRWVSMWQFNQPHCICDSIAILDLNDSGDSLIAYLVVCGLRNGQVHILWFPGESPDSVVLREEIALGHTSVTATVDTTNHGRALLHCDGMLHSLEYQQAPLNSAVGDLQPIWLDNPQSAETGQDSIFAFCQVPASCGISDPWSGTLACVERESLQMVKLDIAGPQNIPRRWQLGGTPVRMVYSKRLDRLVSLSHEITVVRSQQTIGLRVQAGKRALVPVVTFLDINSPAKATVTDPDAVVVDNIEATGTDPGAMVMDNTEAHRQVLNHKPGERFLGMAEWFPEIHHNQYHIFIFHTVITDSHKPSTGRLLFYAVTVANDKTVKLAMKKPIDLPSPVSTVAPVPDEPAIMYCCGNDLVVLSLDPLPTGFRFLPPIKATMRSPGRHLTMHDGFIYVSTANESVQVYLRQRDGLSYHNGDTLARPGLYHFHDKTHDTILATDMAGSVVGLWQPKVRQADNAMNTLFEAEFPRSMTRLIHKDRPSWTHDVLVPGQGIHLVGPTAAGAPYFASIDGVHVHHPKHLRDQRPHAIIGTSMDGTVTQLLVVSTGWRLLKFVQNMCDRHPATCPFKTEALTGHLDPRTDNPRFMHIDGEVLKRLLEGRGPRLLREMLDRPVPSKDSEQGFTDFDSVEDRWLRFGELAAEVLGEKIGADGDRVSLVDEVVRWIGYVLRSALS
ncbi:MAG: hypothetical protein Q9163_001023 [Psora crenata]